MANVLQVAKYIIGRQGSMTTMKLQKLAYYCQAWSLAWDGVPLFEEDFQAWANGPVCPELFDYHRGRFTATAEMFSSIEDATFTSDQTITMDNVLDYYGDKDPLWLSELTHLELPWKDARKGYQPGANCKEVITKDSMQQYYGGLTTSGEETL